MQIRRKNRFKTSMLTNLPKSILIEPKPLFLPIKQIYFDEIESGKKKIEYRADTKHYRSRFLNKKLELRNFKTVIIQMGYNAGAKRMLIEIIDIIYQREFQTHLGSIIERINFKE